MLDAINIKEKYKIFSSPTVEVEHRTAHQADHAVLNLYETRRYAYQYDLQFDNPVIVSMIQGRKVMHLKKQDPFEFLLGQSIVMPASELMHIDFPEASAELPTQCLALEISEGFVWDTLAWLNEYFPKLDNGEWAWSKDNFALLNDKPVQQNLNALIRVMVDNDFGKQLKASNTTRELIVSLMQTQARYYLLENMDKLSTKNRLAHVVKYIRQNLHRPLSADYLASQACLSRAQFFRAFQRELGETPVRFINQERLAKAKKLMQFGHLSATEACYESGFSSVNYFSRVFRQFEGISPTEWKQGLMH